MNTHAKTILAEIHALITEQSEALRGKLTHREAVSYARRARQLRHLLARLRRHFA